VHDADDSACSYAKRATENCLRLANGTLVVIIRLIMKRDTVETSKEYVSVEVTCLFFVATRAAGNVMLNIRNARKIAYDGESKAQKYRLAECELPVPVCIPSS